MFLSLGIKPRCPTRTSSPSHWTRPNLTWMIVSLELNWLKPDVHFYIFPVVSLGTIGWFILTNFCWFLADSWHFASLLGNFWLLSSLAGLYDATRRISQPKECRNAPLLPLIMILHLPMWSIGSLLVLWLSWWNDLFDLFIACILMLSACITDCCGNWIFFFRHYLFLVGKNDSFAY